MSDDVTLTHPDGHGPIQVPERRARVLCKQGWQRSGAVADSEAETGLDDDAGSGDDQQEP